MAYQPAYGNVTDILRELFPGVTDQILTNIINLVEEGNPNDTFEGKLENMINLLSGEEAWGGPLPDVHLPTPQVHTSDDSLTRHYEDLMKIFPDANPEYMLQFLQDRREGFNFDEAVEDLSCNGYDKFEIDPLIVWEELRIALPDADPAYLRTHAERLARLQPQDMDDFLQNALDKPDYPTLKDYLKNKKEQDELTLYKSNFTIDRYLEAVPNPVEFYTNPDRQKSLDENSEENDINYARVFLYNYYNFIRKKYINQLFDWKNRDLVAICDRLDRMGKSMRRPRPILDGTDTSNVALLQEIAYLKNRKLIKRVLKDRNEQYRFAKEEARKYNLLKECPCCCEELIPEECYCCMKGCVFCKDCIRRGVEVKVGSAEFKFPCFAGCNSEFSIQTLQMALPRKTFERIYQKIAIEEVKRANVEGLETCPFCDFAMILPEGEKIFKCENQECLEKSCRECRHKSHVPKKCNEIEYDEDVRRRTYIENKMTEALTRTCYNCKKKFIKSNGCNKMSCNCGAKMCYICGAAVNDYSHFNKKGCPLYTNDTEIDLRRVIEGGLRAKQELGNVQIKFDPTANIENFFRG